MLETTINQMGSELKDLIISKFKLDCDNLKLICNGKMIRFDSFLASQDIRVSALKIIYIYSENSYKLIYDSRIIQRC